MRRENGCRNNDYAVKSQAPHTISSALQYFNTNYASITDLLFLIKEVRDL